MDETSLFKPICDKLNFNLNELESFSSISGGSISVAYRLQLKNNSTYFVKINSLKFQDMFIKEARGLNLLRETCGQLKLPKVISVFEENEKQYLVLEYICPGKTNSNSWVHFGESLANLHKVEFDTFGLEANNFIGLTPQNNNLCDNWFEFFSECRIGFQTKLAFDKNLIDKNDVAEIGRFLVKTEEFFEGSNRYASLIHGDLWSGNVIVDNVGQVVIIDPAVYRGIPEMELAMMQLFGGFPNEFYFSYYATNPLPNGYMDRINICKAYHLLNHLNLFGRGYYDQVYSLIGSYL